MGKLLVLQRILQKRHDETTSVGFINNYYQLSIPASSPQYKCWSSSRSTDHLSYKSCVKAKNTYITHK